MFGSLVWCHLFAGCVAVKWTESTEPVGLRWRASKNFDGGKTVSTSLRLYTVKNRPTTDTQSVTILSWKWPPGKITGKKHELCKVAWKSIEKITQKRKFQIVRGQTEKKSREKENFKSRVGKVKKNHEKKSKKKSSAPKGFELGTSRSYRFEESLHLRSSALTTEPLVHDLKGSNLWQLSWSANIDWISVKETGIDRHVSWQLRYPPKLLNCHML